MIKTIAIGIVLILAGEIGFAQLSSPERSAATSMRKKHWTKARAQLRKAIQKDSLNAAATYLYTRFYFSPQNPFFHIDSAYHYANASIRNFERASLRERDRLRRYPVDNLSLIKLRERIDSAAFERAKSINNENAYLHFISAFPFATQRDQAIVLRDEAAYQDALNENSYESFLKFLDKYPAATRAAEARNKYERLLYEARTMDRQLTTYQRFLNEYPASPYRREAEHHIFEIATASGDVESFIAYLQQYATSAPAKKARNILFHLLQEQEDTVWPENFLSDSLTRILKLNENYLIPILEGGRFGFMDKRGSVIIEPVIPTLPDEYLCGNVYEDVLVFPDKLISRAGAVIFRDTLEEVDDIGYGFLKLTVNDCVKVVHKSGFTLHDCVADARIVAGKFLALKKNNQWALFTLAGRGLTVYEWDEITAVKNIIVFKKDKKFRLTKARSIGLLADQQPLKNIVDADEIKIWPKDLLWIRMDDREGLLNQELQPVVPVTQQALEQISLGVLSKSSEGQVVYFYNGKKTPAYHQIRVNDPWIAVKETGQWKLLHADVEGYLSSSYDSLRFTGPFAIGANRDSASIHFNATHKLRVYKPAAITFLPGKDSITFLVVEEQEKKTVYDHAGNKLFTGDYDAIQHAGQHLFIVSKKDKKGLLQSDGKLLLPVEFSAIGSVTNNVVSLLKNMKFGLYHLAMEKIIKPQYDKNLTVYNGSAITTYQKGLYGFIGWDNTPLGKFEFNEIQYWNDSTALVRKNQHWMLYHIASTEILEDRIERLTFIRDHADEKLAICEQKKHYGVISNRRGFIIPPTFSHIVNLGSAEEPLYFTEKHVAEADFFVVIYYDKNARMLRRQVFDEEEYEKIYCSDK